MKKRGKKKKKGKRRKKCRKIEERLKKKYCYLIEYCVGFQFGNTEETKESKPDMKHGKIGFANNAKLEI